MKPSLTINVLLAFCIALAPASAQRALQPAASAGNSPDASSQDTMPPTAPDFAATPELVAPLLPPPVPPRPPLIVTSGMAAAPSNQTVFSKPALAWRAKAQDLKASQQAPTRVLTATYDDAVMALVACLPQFSLKVETLNSRAGELLVAPLDPASKQRYIFCFSEMPPGSVTVKAAASPSSAKANTLIQNLLAGISMQAARRGAL